MSQRELTPSSADAGAGTYVPFAPRSYWPTTIEDDQLWESACAELDAIWSRATATELNGALELIVRAASIDAVSVDALASGKIELGEDDAEIPIAQARVIGEEDHQVSDVLDSQLRGHRRSSSSRVGANRSASPGYGNSMPSSAGLRSRSSSRRSRVQRSTR